MKAPIKFFISQIFLFSVLCCTDSKKLNDERVWNDRTIFLQGQIMDADLNILVSREIKIIDSLLIIRSADEAEYPIFQVFAMNNEKRLEYCCGFGRTGQGPNEFMWPTKMQIFNDTISIIDRTLQRNYLIDSEQIKNKEMQINFDVEKVMNVSLFFRLLRIKKSLYFGTHYKNRFAFYKNDSIIPTEILFPEDGIVASSEQKAMVYQSNLAIQPDGNCIVCAGADGHILEIYELTSETSLKNIFSDIYEFPKYEPLISENYMKSNTTPDCKQGFFDVSVTNRYIYTLYCGKTLKDKRIDYANIIYIYDWEGNRIKKLILDKDLSGIAVDKNDKKIYGLHTDPEDDKLKVVCYLYDKHKL